MSRIRAAAAAAALLLTGAIFGSLTLPPAVSVAPDPTACGAPPPAPTSTEAAVVQGWGSPISGDEFNYTGAPSSAIWSTYNSAGHAGKGLRRPSQWAVNGSYVRVTGLPNGTTGGMSHKVRGTTYGRWEARMRVPSRSVQYHPVLIVWPDAGRVAANNYQEIDFSEATSPLGVDRFYLHAAKGGSGSGQSSASKTIDMTQWHNYAVDWQPGRITGYIDGVKWFEDTANAAKVKAPAHLTIQLDWFPNGSATSTSYMDVDWARVYKP